MTEAQKLIMVKALLGITDSTEDSTLEMYLAFSKQEIINWKYSSVGIPEKADVPQEDETTQIMAVVNGFSISGAENETMHIENGISRMFKYTDMVNYIRNHVIAYAGGLK